MLLLALPPADHLLIERDRGQFVPSRRRRMMANVRAERLLKILAEPSPEQRIPGAAAQTRVVSMAGIRLGSWESARTRLVSPAQASLPRSWPTPELRIPNAAAQTRIASSLGRWRTLLVEPRGIQGALSSRLVSARIIGGKGCRNIPHEILLR